MLYFAILLMGRNDPVPPMVFDIVKTPAAAEFAMSRPRWANHENGFDQIRFSFALTQQIIKKIQQIHNYILGIHGLFGYILIVYLLFPRTKQ
jgi:hypothetical protein